QKGLRASDTSKFLIHLHLVQVPPVSTRATCTCISFPASLHRLLPLAGLPFSPCPHELHPLPCLPFSPCPPYHLHSYALGRLRYLCHIEARADAYFMVLGGW